MSKSVSQDQFEARLEEHRKWIDGSGGRQLDVSGLSLINIDLAGRDLIESVLVGVDLTGCDLARTVFARCNLADAKFLGAKMQGADFYKAELSGADLTHADLTGARLMRNDIHGAVLESAVLDRSQMCKAFFFDCDLRGASLRLVTMDRPAFHRTQVAGWDATGAVGTVLPGDLVIDDGEEVDVIDALRAAGAAVTPFVRKESE